MCCTGEQEQHQCPDCKIVFYKEKKLRIHITKHHKTPEKVVEAKGNIVIPNNNSSIRQVFLRVSN